ncbi:ATP-binding cassette domain-containing protein [Streptomyces sp. NRRL F-5635]|uniref:ABC transporter ATP-binding protein/permease n=1 Tax=Streptomyces sp. NRRL F-5635 TaxID=1463865 RepID=UPI000AA4656C|nr:ATP-binding cassette domain-containing protein [Streptomyces sp. NRRL F-5635]
MTVSPPGPRPRRLGAACLDGLALVLLGVPVLLAILGPGLAGSTAPDAAPLLPPGADHVLGTDVLGRDVLALVLSGGRSVLAMTLAALLTAGAVGLPLGLFAAGTRRRWADETVMRGLDVLLAFPALLLVMTLAASGHQDATTLVVTAAAVQVPAVTRLVRAAALAPGCRTAVEAMRMQGAPWHHIQGRYVLRRVSAPLITDAGNRGTMILALLASANFLGLGLPTEAPDWAVLVERNAEALFLQPYAVLVPAVLLTALAVGGNLTADRLLGRTRRAQILTGTVPKAGGADPAATDPASATTRSQTARALHPGAALGSGFAPDAVRPDHELAQGPAAEPLLVCRGLTARTSAGATLLHDVSLELGQGRCLALVGPSGSGKTTLGLAVLALTHPGLSLTGSVRLNGTDLLALSPRELRAARAGTVAHLPQDPASVLDPARRVGAVLRELAALHHSQDASPAGPVRRRRRVAAAEDVRRALRSAGLPEDGPLTRRHPHRLSGGQQQRMALATALVTRPRLLVLDEPTSGLDEHTTALLTRSLRDLMSDGTALLLITHDARLAGELADETVALQDGRVFHRETTGRPPVPAEGEREHSGPCVPPPAPERASDGVRAHRLTVIGDDPSRPRLSPVDLVFPPGSRTVVTGLSGAGKTTLARALAGLTPATAGRVEHRGTVLAAVAERRDRAALRAVQYVHQDTRASFDEYRPVIDQLTWTARLLRGLTSAEARQEAESLARRLGLAPDSLGRRPTALSGGQLQRAALIRALTAHPALLICDEVTSALDPPAARATVDLLAAESERTGVAVLFVTHDRPLFDSVAHAWLQVTDGRVEVRAARR